MYLTDIAEESHKYKVVTYSDHKQDEFVKYFNNYIEALEFWKRTVMRKSGAEFTASSALIKISTGEPINRQTWRV